MAEEELRDEAIRRGLPRRVDLEPNHLYVCYMDEFENEYVVRRGILTIVSADGKVY